MRYFYFHSLNPQYFFPRGFKQHPFFLSFYQPYSFAGRVSWWMFRSFPLFGLLFSKTSIEQYVPETKIKKELPSGSLLAFNRGTPGLEQKITALGIIPRTNEKFFIKYAESALAQTNVSNEGNILNQLNLEFIPKLIKKVETNEFTLIKTSVLKGTRHTSEKVGRKINNILDIFTTQKIEAKIIYQGKLKIAFAHGDFCPWNIIKHKKKLYVFDWEMAGYYSFGYDLFTFIFQTSFLLHPKRSIQEIIDMNIYKIENFFSNHNISLWKSYLMAFAETKLMIETGKENKDLMNHYQKLYSYAKAL